MYVQSGLLDLSSERLKLKTNESKVRDEILHRFVQIEVDL